MEDSEQARKHAQHLYGVALLQLERANAALTHEFENGTVPTDEELAAVRAAHQAVQNARTYWMHCVSDERH